MRADLCPLQMLLFAVSGWVNRHQQDMIAYLIEENRVLKEQLRGRRLRLSDDQRRPHSSLEDQTPDEAYTRGAAQRPGLRPASPQPKAALIMNPDPTLVVTENGPKDGVHL